MHMLKENLRFDQALAPQVLNNSNVTSTYISMAKYATVTFECHAGSIPVGGALAWAAYEATDTAGSDGKAISGKTGSHADTADNTVVTVEVAADELDVAGGFDCVAIKCTESGSQNCYISASSVRGRARYPQATPPA